MLRTRALSLIFLATLLTGAGVAIAGATGGPAGAEAAPPAASAGTAAPISPVSTPGQPSSVRGGPSVIASCPNLTGTGDDATAGTATHLFTRTTADAVTIRTYRLPSVVLGCGAVPLDNSSPAPLFPCNGSSVSIEMSDETAVGQGDLSLPYADPSPTTPDAGTDPQSISTGTFGVVEGDTVWWVAIAVGSDVATGQVTFADGSTDQMAPVEGVVVLAHHISIAPTWNPYNVRGTLQLLDSSGSVVRTVILPAPPVSNPPPLPVPMPAPMPAPMPQTGAQTGSSGTASTASGPASLPLGVIACPMVPVTSLPPTTPPTTKATSKSS